VTDKNGLVKFLILAKGTFDFLHFVLKKEKNDLVSCRRASFRLGCCAAFDCLFIAKVRKGRVCLNCKGFYNSLRIQGLKLQFWKANANGFLLPRSYSNFFPNYCDAAQFHSEVRAGAAPGPSLNCGLGLGLLLHNTKAQSRTGLVFGLSPHARPRARPQGRPSPQKPKPAV
jgi:hypothetical protein